MCAYPQRPSSGQWLAPRYRPDIVLVRKDERRKLLIVLILVQRYMNHYIGPKVALRYHAFAGQRRGQCLYQQI